MGRDIYLSNAAEALAYCRDLVRDGTADLFRGQAYDWPMIAPSLFRGNDETKARARTVLNEFREWAQLVPQMAAYHGSLEAITAIAQHYGIPTPLLDLTSAPEIAELFACGASDLSDEKNAVIYCFQSENLKCLPSFSIVELDVANLWRLQAQHGLFLEYQNEADLNAIRAAAIRLHFPRRELSPEEMVRLYPVRKSALEIVVDQWIYRHQVSQLFDSLAGIKRKGLFRRYTYPGMFRWREVPTLEGQWISHHPGWVFSASESVEAVIEATTCHLSLLDATNVVPAFEELRHQVSHFIEAYAANGGSIAFAIELPGQAKTSSNASLLLNRCWDGIRVHPYEMESAIACIAATALALIRPVLNPESDDWEEALWGEVESIDTAPVGGHLDAAGVKKGDLIAARHSVYDDRMTAYARRKSAADPLYLMDYVVDPWVLFDFKRLSRMFVEQYVPSCIGWNWAEMLKSEKDEIADLWGLSFNPALLAFVTRFGFRFTSPIASEQDVEHLIIIASDMDEGEIEETFISALPSVLLGGEPFVVRFSDYSSDQRELWEIDSVVEQCQMIMRVGGISVLEVFPGMRDMDAPPPDDGPAGFGALHIWAIAHGRLAEVTGVEMGSIRDILAEFWNDLRHSNATLERLGKAQPDWPLA